MGTAACMMRIPFCVPQETSNAGRIVRIFSDKSMSEVRNGVSIAIGPNVSRHSIILVIGPSKKEAKPKAAIPISVFVRFNHVGYCF